MLVTQSESLLGGQTELPHCCQGKRCTWGGFSPAHRAPSFLCCNHVLQPHSTAQRFSAAKPHPQGVKAVFFLLLATLSTLQSDLQSCLCSVSPSWSGTDVWGARCEQKATSSPRLLSAHLCHILIAEHNPGEDPAPQRGSAQENTKQRGTAADQAASHCISTSCF